MSVIFSSYANDTLIFPLFYESKGAFSPGIHGYVYIYFFFKLTSQFYFTQLNACWVNTPRRTATSREHKCLSNYNI